MTDDELEARMRAVIAGGPLALRVEVWEGVEARSARQAPRRFRVFAIAAGLAAVAGAALLWSGGPQVKAIVVGESADSTAPSFFGPDALMAQSSAPAYSVVNLDEPIGRRLRPGVWSYVSFRGSDSMAGYTYSARRAELNGQPAWLLVNGDGPATDTRRGSDSLWATSDSLRPLMRVSLFPGGRREQTFRKDDVLIGMTHNGYTTWQTRPLRDSTRHQSGAIIRWSEVAAILQTTRLTDGWKGSVPLAGSAEFGVIAPVWFNFQIIGSDTITVPAGTFDSWRMRLGMTTEVDSLIRGERPGITIWVSKQQRWILQQTYVFPGKATWKHVLTYAKED